MLRKWQWLWMGAAALVAKSRARARGRARSWTDCYGRAMQAEPKARATDLEVEARIVWRQLRAQVAKA